MITTYMVENRKGENKMAKKKIDFSNVETYERAPEGVHIAKITAVEETTFQSGNEGFKVAFEITKGEGKGCKVYENYPLTDTALWKLKTLLEAIKIKCDGRIMLDTDKMVGKLCEIEVNHEEYDGKTRARLANVRKIGVSKAEEDPEEDEDIDDEIDDEEEEEVEEKKPAKKPAKKTAKKQPEPEEDDEDEEDDEEEEKPAKKANKPAKKASSKAKKKAEPEEDDDDWDDDDWDDEE